jgi:hypothetical protein
MLPSTSPLFIEENQCPHRPWREAGGDPGPDSRRGWCGGAEDYETRRDSRGRTTRRDSPLLVSPARPFPTGAGPGGWSRVRRGWRPRGVSTLSPPLLLPPSLPASIPLSTFPSPLPLSPSPSLPPPPLSLCICIHLPFLHPHPLHSSGQGSARRGGQGSAR